MLLLTTAAAVKVRPWFYRDGNWWGLGVDAATPGTAPLVADPANKNGNGQPFAHGRYIKDRSNLWFCLVKESGLMSDLDKVWMDGSVFGDLP